MKIVSGTAMANLFDLYKYIENLLIYNNDSKTDLINAIYAQQ